MAPYLLEDEKFAIDFIEKNALEVMESPGFLNLTPHVCHVSQSSTHLHSIAIDSRYDVVIIHL
jgi:hypothetical protein